MSKQISIAIGKDWAKWDSKFAFVLDQKIACGYPINYKIVNLDVDNWLSELEPYNLIIWNPNFMGINLASHFKEKIYFLQNILNKTVIPGLSTVWHFESKVAQRFLFEYYGINSPRTVVSFDYQDACEMLEREKMPIVTKLSAGAGSQNVSLVTSKKRAQAKLDAVFCEQLWTEKRKTTESKIQMLLRNIRYRWLWERLLQRAGIRRKGEGVIYWQEFIPNNPRDLRITVIGDRYAYGFWRGNRPNDFRASGSGRLDYLTPVPEEQVRYCIDINRKFGFDSMCYDVLFTKDSFVLTEMSYNYLDKAVYNANGYYTLCQDGSLKFETRHTWPQELWVEWALHRIEI